MKIEAVELRVLQMRLLRPFRTSFGVQQDRFPLLLRLQCEGISGWSECVAGEGPWYSSETVDGAWGILTQYLIPAVRGRELASVEDLERLMRPVRGHRMAKAALEMGLSGAFAEAAQKSLASWLGGVRSSVETGVSVGIQANLESLFQQIEEHLSQGYQRIKIKIEPGWDLDVLAAIRSRYPEMSLMADANSAYDLDDAPRLREVDHYGLLMLEQPLTAGDLLDHAADEFVLRRQLQQPVRFLDDGVGLHDDRSMEFVPLQNRRELMGQKVAAQRRFSGWHPGILEPLDIPEVLVRIDPHGSMINMTNGKRRRSGLVKRRVCTAALVRGASGNCHG